MNGRGEFGSGWGNEVGSGPHLQSGPGYCRVHFRGGSSDKMLRPRWAEECRDEEFAGRDGRRSPYDDHCRWWQSRIGKCHWSSGGGSLVAAGRHGRSARLSRAQTQSHCHTRCHTRTRCPVHPALQQTGLGPANSSRFASISSIWASLSSPAIWPCGLGSWSLCWLRYPPTATTARAIAIAPSPLQIAGTHIQLLRITARLPMCGGGDI